MGYRRSFCTNGLETVNSRGRLWRTLFLASGLVLLGALLSAGVAFSLLPIADPAQATPGSNPEGCPVWQEQILFQDDFQDGEADGWWFFEDPTWAVEEEDGDYVLSGSGGTYEAQLAEERNWTDFRFQARVKLLSGAAYLNYRLGETGVYTLNFYEEGLDLSKEAPWGTVTDLATDSQPHTFNTWYTVEISGTAGHLQVYVDGNLRIEVTDPDPVVAGSIALGTMDNSHVHFDDVEVVGPVCTELTWRRTGSLPGGGIAALEIAPSSPSTVYLAANVNDMGVWRSTDAGETWRRAGQPAAHAQTLAVHPDDPNVVFVAGLHGEIWKTTDGGKIWEMTYHRPEEGEEEADIDTLAISPSRPDVVYAGTWEGTWEDGSLLKSQDGGENWSRVATGLAPITVLSVSPTNPDVVYAGTEDGINRSTDGGSTWEPVGVLEPPDLGEILFQDDFESGRGTWEGNFQIVQEDGGNHALKFAGEDGGFATRGGTRYRDYALDLRFKLMGGTTQVYFRWGEEARYIVGVNATEVSLQKEVDANTPPLEDLRTSALEIPLDTWHALRIIGLGPILHVFIDGEPVITYTDDDPILEEGDVSLEALPGTEVYFDDITARALVEGTGETGANLAGRSVLATAIDPSNPHTLYIGTTNAGAFKSTDGGAQWMAVNAGLGEQEVLDLVIAPSAPNVLYAATHEGVYKSEDAGVQWRRTSSGLSYEDIGALAVDPTDANTVYAGTGPVVWIPGHPHFPQDIRYDEGLYKTTNGGASWAKLDGDFADDDVIVVTLDPSDPSTLYAGTACSRGAFRSTDGGHTWGLLPGGDPTEGFDLAHYTMDIVVGTAPPHPVYLTGRFGVAKSLDQGITWQDLSYRRHFHGVAIDPTDSQTIYVGTAAEYDATGSDVYPGAHIFKTTDGGETIREVDDGFPHGAETAIHNIVVDPAAPDTVYLATTTHGHPAATTALGVYKTTDGGLTWAPANNGLTTLEVMVLAIDPSEPDVLYAGTADGVFKTDDGAGTWTPIGLDGISVHDLAVDPSDSNRIYAGSDAGVFKTSDGGNNWYTVNFGLSVTEVRSLALEPTGDVLYAAVQGAGVFRAVINQEAGVSITAPANQRGQPGEVLTYTFTLQNTGNVQDTFDLQAVSSNGWPTDIVDGPSIGPMDYSLSTTFDIRITIPAGAPPGTTDVLTLTATSQLDPTVSTSASVTTTVCVLGDLNCDPVKLGVMIPLTGPLHQFGPNFQRAAELAQMHLSEAGYEIELLFGDTETSAAPAVETARQLVEVEGVHVLVGATSTDVTIPIAESVTIPNQVPQLSYASTSPLITHLPADEGQDFLFRTVPSDALQGTVLADLARAHGYETVSALYVNNPYGQGLNDVFKEHFETQGGTVAASVPHDEAPASTYTAELQQAAEGDPEVLLALSYSEHASVYVDEALDGGFFDQFLFVDGTKSQAIIDAVGADALEGMCGTAPGSADTPSLETFNTTYEDTYGEPPPLPFMSNVYDAVVISALAAYEAQSAGAGLSPVSVRDHLRSVAGPGGEKVGAGPDELTRAIQRLSQGASINYAGAAGAEDFDANGDVTTPVEVWCYAGGEIVSKYLVAPVSPCGLIGDVNSDDVVDLSDIALVAGTWRARLGELNYDLDYDLDNNGETNIVDVQLVTIHVNESCDASPSLVAQ